MAYLATNVFIADGVRTYWDFEFAGVSPDSDSGTTPYLFPADVRAQELYIDSEGVAVAADRIVTIDPALPNRANIAGLPIAAGREVKIYRKTEIRFPLVDYRDRQTVSESDLDLANRQSIFIAQETLDASSGGILLDEHGNFDVKNRRVVNLAPGINPTDAVNMDQLGHALRVPSSEPAIAALPGAVARANRLLSFDATGAPVVTSPSDDSATALRTELADGTRGSNLIGHKFDGVSPVRDVHAKLQDYVVPADFADLAAFILGRVGRLSRDISGRLRTTSYMAGDRELSGSALLDAYVAARDITTETNCHAFADITRILNITDVGGYGAFDATTEIWHSVIQQHIFSFQDRIRLYGSGTIEKTCGTYSRPEIHGPGTILSRNGVWIHDVYIAPGATGSVVENVGVRIEDLTKGTTKVAVSASQSTGYLLYHSGLAPTFHRGALRVGVAATPATTSGIEVTGQAGAVTAIVDSSTALGAVYGTGQNAPVTILANAAVRLQVKNAAGEYAVCPGGPQPLGDLANPWRDVYSTNLRPGAGTVTWTSGAGSPQGVITAAVGSMYTNTTGAAGTVLWIKETGTGNTGWVSK